MSAVRPSVKILLDWIRFRLALTSTSNGWSVARVFEDAGYDHPHATPVGVGPGGAASSFDVTLQEPRQLRVLYKLVEATWPSSSSTLTGMEVSMDTYKTGADQFELGKIIADRLRWMEYRGEGKWHLYRQKGGGQVALDRYGHDAVWIAKTSDDEDEECIGLTPGGGGMSQDELAWHLALGWQLTDHDKWKKPPVRYRLQVKTTDRGGAVKLPPPLWRARFEVTLSDSVLPWKGLRDLERADFTEFGIYFRFRRPAASLHPALAAAVRAAPAADWQPGRPGKYEKPRWIAGRGGLPLKYRVVADADSPLNKVIYDGLRNLGGRLAR